VSDIPGASGGPAVEAGLLSPVWAGTEVAELVSDEAWAGALLSVEAALAAAQARLGVIPVDAAAVITRVARSGEWDIARLASELAVAARQAGNPVVTLVRTLTDAVAESDPAAAAYVHQGATSQDIMDSATMLVSARALARIETDLRRTAAALAGHAQRHRLTPMAGRTLTQHAVPITFGLKAAGWLNGVLDALARVRPLVTGLPAQLGGAAGTLAGYVEHARSSADPAAHGVRLLACFADELELAEPVLPWHTTRTPVAELGAALSLVTGSLGKIAVDVLGLSRTEVAEVAEPAGVGRGGSSAMPQKRNPVLSALIVSAARQVPGHALIMWQSMLAEDERAAGGWQAEWQPLRECLRLAGGAAGAAAELAEGLTVFPDRMRSNVDITGGAVVSERLTAWLAPVLGKAAAKDLLGRVLAAAANGDGTLAELLVTDLELAGRVDAKTVRDLLDPERYLGSSGELVDRALRRYRADMGSGPP
jgi:3-carboxy-cis,cis-muconate cycloisomerase